MKRRTPFFLSLLIAALIVVGVLLASFFSITVSSLPALKKFGLDFFLGKQWDPPAKVFGALPFLIGTLITSFLALLFSLPFSLSISILLGEYLKKGRLASLLKSLVDLIAAVPSVIYGFWGLQVLVPWMREFEMKIGVSPYGVGILTASFILSVMIIPNTASIAREVLELVPADLKEAAYSLGATRYEVIKRVSIPYAKSGILAGVLLSLGRALGETMAVTMVIGNSNVIPRDIFSPANTMASVIANEFTEATGNLYYSSLIAIGFFLFLITAVFSILGRHIIKRSSLK